MVDAPDGDWYAFMMQDRGGVGRVADTDADAGSAGTDSPSSAKTAEVPHSVSDTRLQSCTEPVAPSTWHYGPA